MKKLINIIILSCLLALVSNSTNAQIPIITIIKQGIKKVIIAVDLQVQRIQNKTIWLQNAQKTLENEMSKLKLDEITDWVQKQKDLYEGYFDELWKVKSILTYYNKVQEIIKQQGQIADEYSHAWQLTQQDENFTIEELEYIYKVYGGILDESLKNVDQLFLVINAFITQMNDAERLKIINAAADNIGKNLADLRRFNQQNIGISIQRSSAQNNIDIVKRLYGLE
ncbi:MAG: conjugal transfer protein TraI [Chitinophagaceae bacterium]